MIDDMTKSRRAAVAPRIRFEADYIARTYGHITRNPDVALTELVANTWDAGASKVEITIPTEPGDELIVEDDGVGLTPSEFAERWMTLAYARKDRQGDEVEFPAGRTGRRLAFGRNGVGRHGLFCFGNAYDVTTCKAGKRYSVSVERSQDAGKDPIKVERPQIEEVPSHLHGTRLCVRIQHKSPDAEKIREVLGCRFVADPSFQILVNGVPVQAQETTGFIDQKVVVLNGITLRLKTYDSGSTGRTMRQSGIAFWVGKRLVGQPSWTIGDHNILDGRIKHARRLVIVAETDDLLDEVEEDWSGFRDGENVEAVKRAAIEYAEEVVRKHLSSRVEVTTSDAVRRNAERLQALDPEQRSEVSELIEQVTKLSPTISQDNLEVMIVAASNLMESKRGSALLQKLSTLTPTDIDGLDLLLGQWSVRDCQTVMGEIHRRVSQIEALEKLMNEKGVDELHVLHPLVTAARWLFGPEYDSSEFTSNVAIKTAMTDIFKKNFKDTDFLNSRKRPDLLIVPNKITLSATATEVYMLGESLPKLHQILLIELKCGGYAISREEVNQAVGYVQDLHHSGKLYGTPTVTAYVVGAEIAPKTSIQHDVKDEEGRLQGTVIATTYSRLISAANRRLFKLRESIDERYKDLSGQSLIDRILSENGIQQDFRKDTTPPTPATPTAIEVNDSVPPVPHEQSPPSQ